MITTLELKALKPSDHDRVLSDGGSLRGFVHAAKDGRVSVHFKFAYKFKGKARTLPVGTWPDAGLTAIRATRDAAKNTINGGKGSDPIAQREMEREAQALASVAERDAQAKQQALDHLKAEADHQQALLEQQQRLEVIAAQQARHTVRDLFGAWHRQELCKREDGGSETLRSFNADVFPLLGDMAAEDVKKAHIRQVLDGIQARGTPNKPMIRTQKKTLSDLRQMFVFAIDRDLLEADPTASVKKKALVHQHEIYGT